MKAATESTPLAPSAEPPAAEPQPSPPGQLPWLLMLASGLVLIIDICFHWDRVGVYDRYLYSAVVGGVAMVLSVGSLCLIRCCPEQYTRLIVSSGKYDNLTVRDRFLGELHVGRVIAMISMFWWGIGVGILTFMGPYNSIGAKRPPRQRSPRSSSAVGP